MSFTAKNSSKAFGIAVIAAVSVFIWGCGEDSHSISVVESKVIDNSTNSQCTPQKCEELNVQCGPADDGCGKQIYCGTCELGFSCNLGTCVEGGVSCVARSCEELEVTCGEIDDGCGATLNCGTCGENQGCVDGSCVVLCTPKTCEELNLMCGNADNGCGKELECGGCGEDQTCTEGACVDNCKPLTCEDLSWSCGDGDDGCGGKLECGGCGEEQECKAGQCVDLKPTGTITEGGAVICRRSPQNRNMMGESCGSKSPGPGCYNDLVNKDHKSGLQGTEPAQKVKDVNAGDSFELLAKVDNPNNHSEGGQVWYKVKIDGQACYLPSSRLKTNGIDVPNVEWCSGSTVNYTQGDSRWAAHKYNDTTISSDGCGPSSLANIISALTGKKDVTPPVVGDKYMANSGKPMDRFCKVAQSYGLKCEQYDTQCGNEGTKTDPNYTYCHGKIDETRQKEKDIIVKTLKAGGFVMCMQAVGYWTNFGHWITLYGYDKESGNVFADDPMNRKYIQHIDNFLVVNNLMVAITK